MICSPYERQRKTKLSHIGGVILCERRSTKARNAMSVSDVVVIDRETVPLLVGEIDGRLSRLKRNKKCSIIQQKDHGGCCQMGGNSIWHKGLAESER